MAINTEDHQTEAFGPLFDLLDDLGPRKKRKMPPERIEVREASGVRHFEDEDPLTGLAGLVGQLHARGAHQVSFNGRSNQRQAHFVQNGGLDARPQNLTQVAGGLPSLFQRICQLIDADRRRGRRRPGDGLKEIRQWRAIELDASLLHSRPVDSEENRRGHQRERCQNGGARDASRWSARRGVVGAGRVRH